MGTCLFYLLYSFKWYGVIIIMHSSLWDLRIWWDLSYSHRRTKASSSPCFCAIRTPFCKGVILLGTVICSLKANPSSQGVSGLKRWGSTKGAVGRARKICSCLLSYFWLLFFIFIVFLPHHLCYHINSFPPFVLVFALQNPLNLRFLIAAVLKQC